MSVKSFSMCYVCLCLCLVCGFKQHNVSDLHALCVSVLHSIILLSSMVGGYCDLFFLLLLKLHLYYFQFVAIITKATYEDSYTVLYIYVFISLDYVLKNGIPGSWVKCMFNFVRNCQTFLQRGGSFLHSHQHYMKVPLFPHLHGHVVVSVFF